VSAIDDCKCDWIILPRFAIAYDERIEFYKAMLREKVKQEIEQLSEDQLKQVESFIAAIQVQSEQSQKPKRFWETATQEEWLKDFREWTQQFPKTGGSLPDEALDRESIYGE
jgi:hypothetical protein